MRRRALSVLLVGAALTLPAAHGAFAEDSPVAIRGVNVEGYPNVSVTVSVAGSTLPESIRVTENGSPASILTVRPLIQSGQKIDVVLAIDTSRSVEGATLQAAVAAAQTFVQTLPEGVPVGVLTFSDGARVVLDLTADRSAVLGALQWINETQTGTTVYDAVAVAASMFSGSGQHNLVLLTRGGGRDFGSQIDLPTAIAAAQRAHVAIFTIGVKSTGSAAQTLETLADQTGGTFAPATTADLARLYTDVAARLSRQYLILYRSGAPGGAQVTISVEAPDGTDSSIVLMPRLRTPPGSGAKPSQPFLVGSLGLWVVVALSFVAVFLLLFLPLEGLVRARRERILATRMRAKPEGTPPGPQGPGRSLTAWIPDPFVQAAERVADAAGVRATLDRRLEMAGLPIRAGEVLAVSFICSSVLGVLVGFVLRSVLFGIAVGAVAAAAPFVFIAVAMNRRIDALNEQLPDILMVLASSMRAGHSFLQALDTVSKEIGEPAGPEFARVVGEIRLGRPFDEAINAMAERVGSEEFRWAMLAVNVQRDVGGNLAEILDTLADTVRERRAVYRQIKVLSSEGRLSIRILVVLPFLITLYVIKVNPSYMRLLWTTWLGWVMVAVGGFLMAAGVIWARKIVKIDV